MTPNDEQPLGPGRASAGDDQAPDADEVPLRAVIRRLLTPARAGLFLGRADLARLGAAIGFPLPALDRRLMLEHLFVATAPAGALPRLLDLLVAEADAWVATYEEWERLYPRSATIWAEWRGRAQALRAELAEMRAAATSLAAEPTASQPTPEG